jgi:hypothetical protein
MVKARPMVFVGCHILESFALLTSALFVAAGAFLAWSFDPAWLNRAGALVIIVGVLLAASRFQEWIQSKFMSFFQANFDSSFDDAIAESVLALTTEEREELKTEVKPLVHKKISEMVEDSKHRLKAWEVWLVVIGTFLSGFGDFIVSVIKTRLP